MTTPRLTVYVRGIGLLGPGWADWCSARATLCDPTTWQPSPVALPAPSQLPPAERRRTSDIVKLSLAVAEQACRDSGIDTRTLATVFSASTGDTHNCHALCEALASAEQAVSPTRFTNSVHNAAAGYWHIATASQAPSTSLSAYDASVGAGLIEAAVQCTTEQRPVLLVTGDVPYPEPLRSVRPVSTTLGMALLLSPEPGPHDLARLVLTLGPAPATPLTDPALETLRLAVPTGRALPLLQALAHRATTTVVMEYLDELALSIEVDATPWPDTP